MRIGLDLDGTIIDHRPNKMLLAKDYGYILEPWQTNANVIRQFVDERHITDLHAKTYQHLTLTAPAMEGALERIARLPGEVFIISARRPQSSAYADIWLANNAVHAHIPRERIHFVGHPSEKRPLIEKFGIDVFLDDELEVLRGLPDAVRRYFFDSDGLADRLGLEPEIRGSKDWVAFLEALR